MKKICLLFSILIVLFFTGTGCVELGIADVSNREPYSQFIGKKYKLKCNCYLVVSSAESKNNNEEVNGGNEIVKDSYKQEEINVPPNCNVKPKIEDSKYYIVACGWNGAPREFSEKYIGTAIGEDPIVGILPIGTEFTVKKIIRSCLDRRMVLTDPFVEITSIKVIANANLLVMGVPYTLVFAHNMVEPVPYESEKK